MHHVLKSLAIALAVFLGIASVRPQLDPFRRGMPETLFWQAKVSATTPHDVLILGDSRANQGLSPDAMRALLFPGTTVLNFAFDSTNLDRRYLTEARRRLGTARCPVVVLALSTRSLSHIRDSENGFLRLARRATPVHGSSWLEHRFAALPWDRLLFRWLQTPNAWQVRDYREDGFLYADGEPRSLKREILWYGSVLDPRREARELRDGLMEAVQDWARSGVNVVALRLPLAPEVAAVEARGSPIDWGRIRTGLEQAGAYWIDVIDDKPFETYDGSHLRGEHALRYSRRLAAELASRIRCLASGQQQDP